MEREENVDVKETQTEDAARADKGEEASTVLGKFKDVDALEKAYEALQAEFTRRSQRLRTLERELENFQKREGASGAEKLRKTAKSRREEAKAFDEFVADVDSRSERKPNSEGEREEAQVCVEPSISALEETEAAETAKGAKEIASSEKKGELSQKDENASARSAADELFQRAFDDEGVRLRIVGEYLTSLGRSGAPVTGKGAGVLASPPTKARTVHQAGNMALLYFKKPLEQ